MSGIDLGPIERDLDSQHFHQMDWDALGVPFDHGLVDEIMAVGGVPEYLARGTHPEEGKSRQAFVKSPQNTSRDYILPAIKLMDQVVESLFSGEQYERARNGWSLFNVNYYDTGDEFPPHNDFGLPGEKYVSKPITVVILSLSGVRRLQVEDNQPIIQRPGTITLLNGEANPRHSAVCLEGPSVSVVADVFALPRSGVEKPVTIPEQAATKTTYVATTRKL